MFSLIPAFKGITLFPQPCRYPAGIQLFLQLFASFHCLLITFTPHHCVSHLSAHRFMCCPQNTMCGVPLPLISLMPARVPLMFHSYSSVFRTPALYHAPTAMRNSYLWGSQISPSFFPFSPTLPDIAVIAIDWSALTEKDSISVNLKPKQLPRALTRYNFIPYLPTFTPP